MSDTTVLPPSSPITVKINLMILKGYFDWFCKKHLPGLTPVITSAYRTTAQNESVGGAENSAHLHGLAYDFVLSDSSGKRLSRDSTKAIFDKSIAPNWSGFSLFEETPGGVYHVHVNLSRDITTYAGIAGVAGVGVGVFKAVQYFFGKG